MVRLQKFLAQAGIASRRASETIIGEGRVEVNGQVVTQMGIRVDAQKDAVAVDGKLIQPLGHHYVAVHKPKGVLCTRKDERKRPILGDLLPTDWDLKPVGRLDRNSEGLIFATNDGEFALRITHPRYSVPKVYMVEVAGEVPQRVLRQFTRGVEHEGERLQACKATLVSANHRRSLVELELTEGKNREVRRLFATQKMKVTRLIRVRIGNVKLGELPAGKWRILTEIEIKSLLRKR
ncbi:MAG: pseudouridine synthase [Verrucomicrobiota bacterium]|jgi:23S rRNA pseudouridine2605 synthase|nr:pseudouridine synthase [Verrucomicrobiota bacterium]